MSELKDVRHILEMAERAAIDGDFSSADELLREAARLQEAELGPLHPDLVNTLNNLAIVAEKTGRPGEAETFYRRAAAIASVSLPPDHPMVAESSKNLADFCREHGLPITPAAAVITPSVQDTLLGLNPIAPEVASSTAETPMDVPVINAGVSPQVRPPSSGRTSPVQPVAAASQPLPPAPRRSSRQLEWVTIGAIVLVITVVFVRQPWSSRRTPTAAPTAAQATVPALPPSAVPAPIEQPEPPKVVPAPIEQPQPPKVVPAPIEQPQPPKVVPPADARDVVTDKPASSAPSSEVISLATVQLCQTLSTGGGRWQCDPPGDSVARGPIVLYTRIRSSRDATVVHRWYREDILRQAVNLTIRANASEGYRTFSRQTVDDVGDWRVEVRSADGALLHEQRFTVR